MHGSYENKLGHKADFRVKYKFYTEAEGGRNLLPYQGIRSDFWYEHKDHEGGWLFMIWPEFENENGRLILDNSQSVPKEGTARMWIIAAEKRPYHKEKIQVGTIGYFREGGRTTAICEVIEIVGLFENPTNN